MPKKTFYKELDDVIFIPKRKPFFRMLFVLILICLIGLAVIVFILNSNQTEENALLQTQNVEKDQGDGFNTIESFSNDWCKGVEAGGEEAYTDWFVIRGDQWRVRFDSERVLKDKDSNTRLWYTTSSESIMDEIMDKKESSYTEIGENRYNVDSKEEDIIVKGPGYYRLRILCWNSKYNIEIQDSTY